MFYARRREAYRLRHQADRFEPPMSKTFGPKSLTRWRADSWPTMA